jgi:para-aminobenzoate synthetase / 4-amino-4-deoxychorismate lyase
MRGDFDLLETLRWTPERGVFLLDRHVNRMADSARHFGFVFDPAGLRVALDRAVLSAAGPQRLRLLLSRDGTVRVECTALDPTRPTARIALAATPIDPDDMFLRHKTTNRAIYEDAKPPHLAAAVDDVVLWNVKRQVTESTIANVVAEIDGRKLTPPVECGLLAGTFRAQLLADGAIEEGIITIDRLRAAPHVWLINSVREWWPATLVTT